MDHSNQYFFSIEKLKALIKEYESKDYQTQMNGLELKGFVFIPGADEKGKAAMFGFPLFSASKGKPGKDGDILIQNTSPKKAGCPYPPPCPKFAENEDCYSK
jgi:hypothetical protein